MAFTTQVPPPDFTPTGFVVPSESAILGGVQGDLQTAFGGALNFTTTTGSVTNATPQGQLSNSLTAIINNTYQTFLYFCNQTDPAFAQGRMQDAIARLYFLTRFPALPTILNIACLGAASTVIPVGALIADDSGYTYQCTNAGTIPNTGTITLQFANTVVGPNAIPESDGVSIVQAIPGWDAVTCSGGTLGQNVETSQQFEQRRENSVEGNSQGSAGPIMGAVAQVPGVLDYYVYDNTTGGSQTILGVTIPASQLYVAVSGGTQAAVAFAIWSKKAPGCSYYTGSGAVTQSVVDPNPGYAGTTAPTYSVSFVIPSNLSIVFSVVMVSNQFLPSNATALIQAAIIQAFAGEFQGLSRARIGALLLATNYIAPILAALPQGCLIQSVQIGSSNADVAQFTASIATTNMTVSAVASGTLAPGQTISDNAVNIPQGTTIISQTSGTTGGTGVYVISNSLTVSGQTIYSVTAANNTVQVNINQEPSVVAADIAVTT